MNNALINDDITLAEVRPLLMGKPIIVYSPGSNWLLLRETSREPESRLCLHLFRYPYETSARRWGASFAFRP